MKRIIGLVLLIILFMNVAGCGQTEGHSAKDGDVDKIQIGMSFDSFVMERWQRDCDIFVSVAKEAGAEVNVQNANGDVERQKKQIDYFIQKGMDVIVVIGIDPERLKGTIARAKEAGIKVIAYDRMLTDSDVDLYISFDNEMVGAMMAQALVDNGVYGGNVIMLGGSPTDSNVAMVESGFRRVMNENGVNILDSMHAQGWKAELASEYVYSHMATVRQAYGIMCGNDELATQTVRALAEEQRAGDILVVGQDADLSACQRIVEGTQLMTVYKPVEKLATRAAQAAVALAKGEEITGEDISVIINGAYQTKYIALEPVSVTKENMDEVIIDSGFHQREDVYLNVQDNRTD